MNHTTHATRFAGFMFAVLMTATVHGAMLWNFDAVAQDATLAATCPTPTVVRLEQVSIVAPQS